MLVSLALLPEATEARPLINEILFLPKPDSPDIRERRRFIELHDPTRALWLGGCHIENNDGSFRLDFDDFDQTFHPFTAGSHLAIKEKSTLKKEYKYRLKGFEGFVWMRDMPLGEVDAVGIFCDNKMVHFVSWGNGLAPDGPLYSAAIAAGIWNASDFVETGGEKTLQPGDSIGRDRRSTNTKSSADWSFTGGIDASSPTPQRQNLYFGLVQ